MKCPKCGLVNPNWVIECECEYDLRMNAIQRSHVGDKRADMQGFRLEWIDKGIRQRCCASCTAQLPEGARFCHSCGAQVLVAGSPSVASDYYLPKDNGFREELRYQSEEAVKGALQILKANITKAAETLVRLLGSKREILVIRAAEDLLEFTLRSTELQELEHRIAMLEAKVKRQEEPEM